VDDPADLTDPISDDEDLYFDWDHDHRHHWKSRFHKAGHKPEGWRFRKAVHEPKYLLDMSREEMGEFTRGPKTDEFKLATIRSQDIPGDVKRQRMMLQDFYTAWKKHKFGPSEESEDEETFIFKIPTRRVVGLAQCKRFPSSIDHLTSAFSLLSNAFLLFANAYPKHAPTCYKMAESSFKMATLASQVLSPLWKLNHGFTLSSMETAIKKLDFPITRILLVFNNACLSFQYLYTVYVKHVTSKKAFERDEEFQIGYEQPPIEAQILAFTSAVDVSSVKLGEVIVQIRKLLERTTDLLKQEEVPGQRMEEGKSDEANTLTDVLDHISAITGHMNTMCKHLNNYKIQDS
jgi:hypothetical protein